MPKGKKNAPQAVSSRLESKGVSAGSMCGMGEGDASLVKNGRLGCHGFPGVCAWED